ncbi:MAG: host attachment protein [Gammaproteobacteria bacterium]|jgi:protein required for attachment to host cells
MNKLRIIVADSARARLFDADPRRKTLDEIGALVHPESRERDSDLVEGKPGRAFDSAGKGRHAMSPHTSPHKQEADAFARHLSDHLTMARNSGEFNHLHLSAPPAFLGLLRKHLDHDVVQCLGRTINKNLVHETPEEIALQFFH